MSFNSDGAVLVEVDVDVERCIQICKQESACKQANYDYTKGDCFIRKEDREEVYPSPCCVHFEKTCGCKCKTKYHTLS